MQPIVEWPTENTAFLVIHGNGPHRQYETLDKFARNFYEALQNPEASWEHKLDDRRWSYVRFKRPGYPYIDFYEYYWDRFMVRDITTKELKDWLKEIYDGIKDDKFIFRKYDTPLLLKPFEGGWHRILLLDCILNRLIGFAADAPIYCLHNQRSSYYEIRGKVLSGAVRELRRLLNSGEKYEQIIVVGHSLGSVIAYDALNRIALNISMPSPSLGVTQASAKRLKGLVTFGSFLDVVAFCFEAEEHVPRENDMERLITVERHAFKKPAATYEGNPIKYKLLNVKWLNFYHHKDVVANQPLVSYELDKGDQIRCDKEGRKASKLKLWESLLYMIPIAKSFKESWEAHGSYWKDKKMYREIARKFF